MVDTPGECALRYLLAVAPPLEFVVHRDVRPSRQAEMEKRGEDLPAGTRSC
jgi:hypothetical protein